MPRVFCRLSELADLCPLMGERHFSHILAFALDRLLLEQQLLRSPGPSLGSITLSGKSLVFAFRM